MSLTTLTIGLQVNPEQKQVLLRTVETFNRACNEIALTGIRDRYSLHRACYRSLREMALSSQMAINAIKHVAAAWKSCPKSTPTFGFHGAISYDQRNSTLRADHVSLSTVAGRLNLSLRLSQYHIHKLKSGRVKRGVNLCYRKDTKKFYLAIAIEHDSPLPVSSGILGIDLGIVHLVTDSEGQNYDDERIEQIRTHYEELRGRLQSIGTKNSRRHLRKLSGRERRFKRDVNHRISKLIVKTAEGTSSMIAMEDLTGIRERTTVRRGQMNRHSKWAFRELRRFVEYKAEETGLQTTTVNPKNTSRTCPKCLNTCRKNRPTRDLFRCTSCGYKAPADYVGALNVRREAAFSLPIAAPMSEVAAAISLPSGVRS
ncbi:MAG: RNA-guided endonuclease TnpB family protein [Nitrososphaerales archaeon]|nr:RNA-guided endonuclease TnpB family protein [Nitrososphaerales archaeon]